MNIPIIFSIEAFEGSNTCIVRYPDGTCDIMTKKEIKENFSAPLVGGNGKYLSYEDAIVTLVEKEENQIPGDFFEKKLNPYEKIDVFGKTHKGLFNPNDQSLV